MYKIVVVDDELWFREGIKGSIRWADYDIEIAGEACDGEEALDVIERVNPDIVFADIRMPVMDGLELASTVVEKYPQIKLIIVSGYEEFEYARKAMSLGVSYYLTKPVDAQQLVEIVNKVKEEIRQEREESCKRKKIEEQLKESLPLLREKFLNSLLSGDFKKDSEIKSKLEFLGVPLKLDNYIVFIVDIEYGKSVLSDHQEKNKQMVRFSVLNLLKELLQEERSILVFNGLDDNISGIATFGSQISAAVSYIQMSKMFDKIRGFVHKSLNITVTIGVSRLNSRWDRVNESYREASDAIKYRLFLGRDQVIFFQDIAMDVNRDNSYSFIDREELIDALKLGNTEKEISVLNNNFNELKRRTSLNYDYIQQIYLGLLGDILSYIHETGVSSEKAFSVNPFREVLGLSTLEEINLWFISACKKLTAMIQYLREQQNQNAIDRVMQYIYDNFSKDISLNSAAEYVFLSPAYLSRLFKKQTGKSFIQYIMEVRVEKAKDLLKATDKKIYEIAKEVGYTDMGYFAKMFKAIEGITPAQYREKA